MTKLEDLVVFLGMDGAIAGLEASDLTIQEILDLDPSRSLSHPKMKRADLIRAVVSSVRERLTKSPEELMSMNVEELRNYLHVIKASREEILTLLLKLDIRPLSSARKSLVEFAAQEISEIGMYRRIAKRERKE